jgi:hypothetical protein
MGDELETRLEAFGYCSGAENFRRLLLALHAEHCDGRAASELLYAPRTALHLCELVREQVGIKLPDELILRALASAVAVDRYQSLFRRCGPTAPAASPDPFFAVPRLPTPRAPAFLESIRLPRTTRQYNECG